VLHRHIVALFYHRVLVINIAAWTNYRLRATSVVEASQALWFEALFASIKYNSVLQLLVTWLVESLRPALFIVIVLARPRNIELKTLAEMSLVEMESWRRCVESHFFANNLLVI